MRVTIIGTEIMSSCLKRFLIRNKTFQEHGFKDGDSAEIGKRKQDYWHNASITPVIGWDAIKIV
jgi:hypothetical protein